jgi:hypothetical protein
MAASKDGGKRSSMVVLCDVSSVMVCAVIVFLLRVEYKIS